MLLSFIITRHNVDAFFLDRELRQATTFLHSILIPQFSQELFRSEKDIDAIDFHLIVAACQKYNCCCDSCLIRSLTNVFRLFVDFVNMLILLASI
jgi:hypothetical protein